MKNIQFKSVGRKSYDGFQWFQCIIDGVKGNKYKALDAQHARKMYEQLNKNVDANLFSSMFNTISK